MKNTRVILIVLCITLMSIASAIAMDLPDVRVKILINSEDDIQTLRAMRIDADYRDGDWLVAEVREEEFKRIRYAGFTTEIMEPDLAAERAMYKARGQHRDYHTYTSLRQEMLDLEAAYPTLAQFIVTGQSVQGRDIMTIKISDNVTVDENEPEIRWEGNIHGDEKIAMEVAIYLVNELLSLYGSDPQITNIVDNREIFFTPSVNPDGMMMSQRYNANGIDCNRDYGYMWDGWGGSPSPWSQPETQAIMDLIMDNQFVVGMSGHSGTEIFLYSWCYTDDQTADELQHDDVQNAYSALSGYSGGQCSQVLYPVNGGSMDADYAMTGAMGVCVEISYQKTPPVSEIDDYCLQNRDAALDMFERVGNGIEGVVTDLQTGEPIPALVDIVEIGWPVYCDPVVGDYHRFVLPGTYSLRVWANDYEPVIIPSVVVPANGTVTVDVQLDRGVDSAAYKVIYCRDNQPSYNNHTKTSDALGPTDGAYYSICVDGYICMDMGETTPIIDYPGFDFTVWEGDATIEGYTVEVANDWQGPWSLVGTGSGTMEFDLAGTGLDTARFVKITDDGDGSASGTDPGFDLDAITTVHVVPGCGVLELDNEMYACDDTVAVSLIDADLNLNPSAVDTATVLITSDSDPSGETVVVTESGPDTSEFYGDVSVQEGSGGSGFVGVHDGDVLTATYEDADCEGQPQTVEVTADIDCAGPVISDVTVIEITDSSALVTWTTEEPSDSMVTYGATMPPATVVTDDQMVLIHEVFLTNLEQCTGYNFMVGSTDAAGNETIDDNGGAYFGFTTWELVVFMDENMVTDPGWTYENQWAWGVPQGNEGDPSSGYTGNHVIGYNLNGDYTNNMPDTFCTTTPFDCSETTQVIFSFYKWLGVESATWDHASIEVSGDGGSSWTMIWEHSGSSTSPSEWTYEEYDVSPQLAGNSNCLIRWNMGPTDSSVTYCGWNIDDVMVTFTQPCEEPCINNGDVNQNGEITAGDAQMAFQIALGQISPTPTEFCSADCNGNEEVTAGDAQQIFMTALGSANCVDPLN